MPGRTKSLLLGTEVRPAGHACDCKHNKAHRILKGELRLVVKTPGPASGEKGYCASCAETMIAAAQVRLTSLLDAVRGLDPLPPID